MSNENQFPVLKAGAKSNFNKLSGAILYQFEAGAKVVEVVSMGAEAYMVATKALITAVSIASTKGMVISQTNPEYCDIETDQGIMTGLRMVIYLLGQ